MVFFFIPTGKRVFEGAERSTAGGLYVQRVEKTRLRRRFQMVSAVHRLTRWTEAQNQERFSGHIFMKCVEEFVFPPKQMISPNTKSNQILTNDQCIQG